jgi:hypothetical protein
MLQIYIFDGINIKIAGAIDRFFTGKKTFSAESIYARLTVDFSLGVKSVQFNRLIKLKYENFTYII